MQYPVVFRRQVATIWRRVSLLIRLRRGCSSARGLLFMAMLVWPALAAAAAMPQGWSDSDIGLPAVAGSADYSGGTWTVAGGGAGICVNDQFHFAWRNVSGDTSISARLDALANSPGSEAGLMLRNDSSAGSLYAAVLASSSGGVRFQWRTSAGASCYYQIVVGGGTLTPPLWLKLTRSGNTFAAFWSTNGTDWPQVGGAQTVAMNPGLLSGPAVTANSIVALATATFSELTTPPPAFGIYRELWTGLNAGLGDTLAALTNSSYNANWPDRPDANFTEVYSAFETGTNTGLAYYGQRLRCYVVPPLTGNYRFWIASDNTSELFLSGDEDPAHKNRIAWVNAFTSAREWTKEPNQQSAPVTLQASQRYYLE
ncbi:MAG TPA: hypothetical protein VJA21_03205, partial [Verrucomicrobiae bacterium]